MHMKRLFLLGFLLFATAPLFQIFAEEATRKFKVNPFRAIEVGEAFEIYIQKGPVCSLTAMGESGDLNDIEVTSTGSVLRIEKDVKWSWGIWSKDKKIVLKITMPELKDAEFSGATKVFVNGFTNEEQMRLSFSGASKVQIAEINADKLILEFSGASKAELAGRVGKLEIGCSGASKVEAKDLLARDVDVDASGASKIELHVQKTLKVEASGASKITYRGRPSISKDLSGASFVQSVP